MLFRLPKYTYYGNLLQFLSVALVVHCGLSNIKEFSPISHLVEAFLASYLHSCYRHCKWLLLRFEMSPSGRWVLQQILSNLWCFPSNARCNRYKWYQKIKNKQTKELPGLLPCLWQWQVLQAEQMEVTGKCWCFMEVLADCNYLWSKDFLTRKSTFIFNSDKWIFLPGIWLIALNCANFGILPQTAVELQHSLCEKASSSFPVASATCSGSQTPSDNVLCSLSPSCSRFHAYSSHPPVIYFQGNGCSFFCNIFSHLYLPWNVGPELCILFWFAIACSGFISAHRRLQLGLT